MPGVIVSDGGSEVIGTVIIYRGKLHENAKKRLAACRKDDEPVLAINLDLFRKNRRTRESRCHYLVDQPSDRQNQFLHPERGIIQKTIRQVLLHQSGCTGLQKEP